VADHDDAGRPVLVLDLEDEVGVLAEVQRLGDAHDHVVVVALDGLELAHFAAGEHALGDHALGELGQVGVEGRLGGPRWSLALRR
jgi:hypothetical protein